MKRLRIPDAMMPWTGLIGGVAGLAVANQLGSDTAFDHCLAGSPWAAIVAVAVGLALAGFGALVSWKVHRGEGEGPARQLIAIVSAGAAALFSLMMVLALISSLVIPPCFA